MGEWELQLQQWLLLLLFCVTVSSLFLAYQGWQGKPSN
jgi:hypothetical protein